ncbi:uncharacterized protein LOC125148575 isoform X2 [Prionailurus viverrinus]|uniref:uncharacterized protein LOC125148575 isoform X2 n=1 Tax=Prionailurus viverrinus TaxID=61388 RepID=UPI001FF0DF8F|nr:uncharacterized protein LOC125148575 isoform X2 [Prionailurus viverrinus]
MQTRERAQPTSAQLSPAQKNLLDDARPHLPADARAKEPMGLHLTRRTVCKGNITNSQYALENSLGSCHVGANCYLSINPVRPVFPPELGQITISPVRLQTKQRRWTEAGAGAVQEGCDHQVREGGIVCNKDGRPCSARWNPGVPARTRDMGCLACSEPRPQGASWLPRVPCGPCRHQVDPAGLALGRARDHVERTSDSPRQDIKITEATQRCLCEPGEDPPS